MSTGEILEAAKPWMQQCGPHDYGIDSAPCGRPPGGDPRVIVSKLVGEIERLVAGAEKVIGDFESTAREHRDAGDKDSAEHHEMLAWKLRRDILGGAS